MENGTVFPANTLENRLVHLEFGAQVPQKNILKINGCCLHLSEKNLT